MWAWITRFKENSVISKENQKIRKNKRVVEKQLENVVADREDYKDKYIKILEEKGDGFNQFVYYHDLYGEVYELNKENKKEIADLKAEAKHNYGVIADKDAELASKDEEIAKLERKIKRLEKKLSEDSGEVAKLCENEQMDEGEKL